MPKVNFSHEGVVVEVPYGANLRKTALDNGVDIYGFPFNLANCRGHGLCGTCKVAVDPEFNVSDRTNAEIRKLKAAPLRLACQCSVEGDIECISQIPVVAERSVQDVACYIIVSPTRREIVQVVEEGKGVQRNVFLDIDDAETVAREIAALYPDGEWELRGFDDPLTTQEFSFSYNPLRYLRPTRGMLADGMGNLLAEPAGTAPALQPRMIGDGTRL